MRGIFVLAWMVIIGILSFGTLIQNSYASLEPPVQFQYPEGGPNVWASVVIPLNWREVSHTKQPSTLIGAKENGQAVLIVVNVQPSAQKFFNLKSLSLSDAQKLWGEARYDRGKTRTFDLQKPFSKSVDYHVDAKFKNEKLSAYRIYAADPFNHLTN
jgi:hypothetical protein